MAEYTASNTAELASAIAAANDSTDGVNTITLTASITLDADLPLLQAQTGTTLVINGGGFSVSGDGEHRIFFADKGDIRITNVTLEDGHAAGGAGGDGSSAGGGGMGAGGALFVNGTASVTIVDVFFADNGAAGGDGGRGALTTGGGGGGGMGGDGGSAPHIYLDFDDEADATGFGIWGGGGGGGGLGGDGGTGGTRGGGVGEDGGAGLATGQAAAGDGAEGSVGDNEGDGGLDGGGGGGGGGGAVDTAGGGGGGGGIGGDDADGINGGDGGDFGGGGGGGGDLADVGSTGGIGGFGGGGGGSGALASIVGGSAGGFGGGGGGESMFGLFAGTGGFGGGDGGGRYEDPENEGSYAGGGGGGGAGFGGAIFVRDGGKLTIGTTAMSGGSVAGGNGSASLGSAVEGGDGQAAGAGMFLQGSGTLGFDIDSGDTATITDAIDDETGLIASGYTPPDGYLAGEWNLSKDGAGTLVLDADNLISGVVKVLLGTLRVDGSTVYALTQVESGGRLGGNGATGLVEVRSGGIVGAGASAGLLTTGGIDLAAGALFEVEVGGTVAGIGGYDQVIADGIVFLDGATLDLALIGDFAPQFGDSFTIIDNDGGDPVHSTFAGLAEGAAFVASGRAFSITYKGGDGNDVVVTAIQAVIIGTSGNDVVDATNTVFGELPATKGDDIIKGKGGNDQLTALAGNDSLYGGDGNDKLKGQAGDDLLKGGKGKDTLKGGAGDDLLEGGAGRNHLTGGADADTFLFKTKLGPYNVSKITDFTPGEDVIHLDKSVFKSLGPLGELGKDHFTVGDKAKGKDAQIVYDRKAGTLTYDKNGSKSDGDTLFAKVDKKLDIHHGDFFLV